MFRAVAGSETAPPEARTSPELLFVVQGTNPGTANTDPRQDTAPLMPMLADDFIAQDCSIHIAVQGQVYGKIMVPLDFEDPLLADMTSTELKGLHIIAEVAGLLIWVTRCGRVSALAPEYAMVVRVRSLSDV